MNISLSASVNAFARAALFAGVSVVALGPVSASADDIGIVVYNAQHESLGVAWAEAFTKETGIEVTLRKGSDMEFANQIVQEGAASPADVAIVREQTQRYEAALLRLRQEDRDLIVSRLELGLTYEEIAASADKPNANAARSAVVRALVRLTEELARGSS